MQNSRLAGTGQAYEIHCAAKARESSGQAQRCRPRPPTSTCRSIAGISLHCREPPPRAKALNRFAIVARWGSS